MCVNVAAATGGTEEAETIARASRNLSELKLKARRSRYMLLREIAAVLALKEECKL